jgi:raffinose/stachyose/melibiose transport system permease protein
MTLMLPMLSYPIARRMKTSRSYRFLYFFILAGLFIPFQVRMMPLIRLMRSMDLLNQIGVILVYLGYSVCEGVFLFSSFMGSVPEELEESAYIDGANTVQIFFRIVFPLLRPMTATVIIKNTLWTWNDFFMPMLVLNKVESRTLPLFQYNFQSEYSIEYPLVFTTFFLSMFPIMLVYVFMQKQIIGGMMAGAVKG